MRRVLIAGCGDVGCALARLLLDDGIEVHGLRRRVALLPDAVVPVGANLETGAGLELLRERFDAVVYTAAASAATPAAYRAAYIEGPARLNAALRGRARWLFVSSTAVYAQRHGELVDEQSVTQPTRFNGQLLLEGEQALAKHATDTVIVRFGGIYGPGRRRLMESVRSGRPCVEQPPQFTNRIHRDDCAGVLAHLLGLDSPAALYAGVDCESAPMHEVMDWLATRLGVPPPPRRAHDEGKAGPGSKRVSNARLLGAGYQFLYPTYRDGYGALLG